MLSLKYFILILWVVFSFENAFAQFGGGNAGHVVEVDAKHLYLLDFLEGGVQETAYFLPSFTGDEWSIDKETQRFIKRATHYLMEKGFHKFGDFGWDIKPLVNKLADLSPVIRDRMLLIINLYDWALVPGRLREVSGLESIIDLTPYRTYVGAIRLDNSITISKPIWDRLDLKNQIGLILHEIIYAMVKPTPKGNFFEQRSWDARLINRSLFKRGASYGDLSKFQRSGKKILTLHPDEVSKELWMINNGTETIWMGGGSRGPQLGYGAFASISDTENIKNSETDYYLLLNRGALDQYAFIERDCEHILLYNVRNKPVYLNANSMLAGATFVDYQTAEGPNQYVSFNYERESGVGLSLGGPGPNDHFEFKGKFKLLYPSKEACMKDLPSKLKEIYEGLMYRYDYKEVYSQ